MNPLAKPILDTLGLFRGPASRDLIRASMHLHAVLPRLRDLGRLDPAGKEILAEMSTALELRVIGGPRVVLRFGGGDVSADRDGRSDMGLLFSSCEKLNRMFDGERVVPLPFGKLWRYRELERFSRLTDILTRYLKPSEAELQDPVFRAHHVEMALLVGLAASHEVAAHDPKGRRIASHLPTGTIQYVVHGGPSCHVAIARASITARTGMVEDPTATIEIRDVDLAVELINGRVDTFAANGSGAIKATGSLVLADEFNSIFDRVGLYLD